MKQHKNTILYSNYHMLIGLFAAADRCASCANNEQYLSSAFISVDLKRDSTRFLPLITTQSHVYASVLWCL